MRYHILNCNVIFWKGKEKVSMRQERRPEKIILVQCKEQQGLDVLTEELEKNSIRLERCSEDNPAYEETALYVCDSSAVAQRLWEQKYPVIIALHEENSYENFSKFTYAVQDLPEVEADFFIKVWQRQKNIPWFVTETSRCYIREMATEDVDALYSIYSDPNVSRYTEQLFEDKDKEKAYIEDYIKNVYAYYGFGNWLVVRKEDDVVIGRAGFDYRPGFDEPELGFVFGTPYQGQGYAYEVCSKLMELCGPVYDLYKVRALAEPENISSCKLLDKLGFHVEKEIVLEGKKYFYFLKEEL